MGVRSIEEINAQFSGLFENKQLYDLCPKDNVVLSPDEDRLSDEREYLRRAVENAKKYSERVDKILSS